MNNHDKERGQILTNIDWDIQPARDLWPEIESKLEPRQNQQAMQNVFYLKFKKIIPLSMAASFLVAVFMYGGFDSQESGNEPTAMGVSHFGEHNRQISLMKSQHAIVRKQLLDVLNRDGGHFDEQFIVDIEHALASIDEAVLELTEGARDDPENAIFSFILAKTYKQESDLLRMLENEESKQS